MTPGQRFGKYKLLTKIADGGMAEVFLAMVAGHGGFQKRVALKVILPHFTKDESFLHSFVNEAQICGQLHHPNLVQVYEFRQQDDTYYLAMEFIDGLDLERILNHCILTRAWLPLEAAVEIVQQMLEGLDYAHTARDMENRPLRIIHRDLKPSNILIEKSGVVKIVDFGVAKAATSRYKTMQQGLAKGTVSYMSPEQAAGKLDLGPPSDLFSLGSILYELISLRRLFDGDNLFAILDTVRNQPLDSAFTLMPPIPPALDHILRKALNRDLNQRYPSARDMARDLRGIFPTQSGPTVLRGLLEKFQGEGLRALGHDVLEPDGEAAVQRRASQMLDVDGPPMDAEVRPISREQRQSHVRATSTSASARARAAGYADAESECVVGGAKALPLVQGPRVAGRDPRRANAYLEDEAFDATHISSARSRAAEKPLVFSEDPDLHTSPAPRQSRFVERPGSRAPTVSRNVSGSEQIEFAKVREAMEITPISNRASAPETGAAWNELLGETTSKVPLGTDFARRGSPMAVSVGQDTAEIPSMRSLLAASENDSDAETPATQLGTAEVQNWKSSASVPVISDTTTRLPMAASRSPVQSQVQGAPSREHNQSAIAQRSPAAQSDRAEAKRSLGTTLIIAIAVFVAGGSILAVLPEVRARIQRLIDPPPPVAVMVEFSDLPDWGQPMFFGDPPPERVDASHYRVVLGEARAYEVWIEGAHAESVERYQITLDPDDPKGWQINKEFTRRSKKGRP